MRKIYSFIFLITKLEQTFTHKNQETDYVTVLSSFFHPLDTLESTRGLTVVQPVRMTDITYPRANFRSYRMRGHDSFRGWIGRSTRSTWCTRGVPRLSILNSERPSSWKRLCYSLGRGDLFAIGNTILSTFDASYIFSERWRTTND